MSGTEETPNAEASADDAMMADWAAAAGTQLDQNSIDSLFGESAAAPETGPRNGLEVLVGNAIVGYDRLPMLDIIVDRFARLVTSSIRKFTSDNCDVSVGKNRPTRVGDFLNRITLPALITVIRAEEWDGYLLAALDAPLIGSVVDILLGGRRNQPQRIEGRPYTPIERTLIEKLMIEVVIPDLQRAFEPVCDINFKVERFETTPLYAAVTKATSAALHFRADVSMDAGRGGGIDFLVPYALLEPVRDVLSQEFMGKKQSGDSIWHHHLRGEVPQASVELRAVLEQRVVQIMDIARWRPGSLLMLHRRSDDPVDLFCEDTLVARAQMGEQEGRIALRIDDACLSATVLTAGDD